MKKSVKKLLLKLNSIKSVNYIKLIKSINKKHIVMAIAGVVLFLMLLGIYSRYFSPTTTTFVNFIDVQYAKFIKANENPFIKIKRLSIKKGEIPNFSRYKIIYVWAHGLNLTPDLKKQIKKAIKKGSKVYMYAATTPETDLCNITGGDLKYVSEYFKYGGIKNYRELLNYSRRIFDRKKFYSKKIKTPEKIPGNVFFHLGENYFTSYNEYQKFYEKKGYYKKNAPKVYIFMGNLGPRNSTRDHIDGLIKGLEKRNFNVYPIDGFTKRLDFMKKVSPDLAVIMPHGRIAPGKGKELIKYLKQKNIPILCPINVFSPYEKWAKDQQGMIGGMMSQSIVMPELDGGIEPFVISAQFKNKQGLYIFKGIKKRIERFCDRVANWYVLKNKPNSQKKIAIYYFKGHGLNSMVAGGMEVAPSLLNLLKYLKKDGYNVGNLPETEKEFLKIIQKKGPVLGAYAKGSFKEFLRNGNPELINKETYIKWCQKNLPLELFENVIKNYGNPPGEYMSITKNNTNYIAVARIQFGNVVLLPQPMPGYGKDELKIIHGVKKAPPHPYIASYLWVKDGFKADAIMHFGTHGSLEFTPWKQVALSDYDWPDILIGDMPHIYIYVINNIGEAIIAKRRSYAVLVSYLTPPFTQSDLYGRLTKLHDKIHYYYLSEDKNLKNQYALSMKKIILSLNIHKDLQIKNLKEKKLKEEDIKKIHNYIHTIEQEKITRGLYTLGIKYKQKYIYETTRLMAVDAVSYSLANMDIIKKKVSNNILNNKHLFDLLYRQKSLRIIDEILLKNADPLSFMDKRDISILKQWEKENKKMTFDEIIANMISMGESTEKKQSMIPKDEKKLESKLKELVVKIASDENKKKLILSLKNEEKFKKSTALLDPDTLKKAKKIARFIPAMKKQIDLIAQDDVLELLKIMQNKKMKEKVFSCLSDPAIKDKIKKEQEKIKQGKIKKLLMQNFVDDLVVSINDKKLKKNIKKWNKERLISFIKHLQFYLDNLSLASDIRINSKNARAISAVLKSKKSIEIIKQAKVTAQNKITAFNEKEKEYVQNVKALKEALELIKKNYNALEISTSEELKGAVRALSGGYISPSSGGDPISNPGSVPTGRNLYAIDAEKTPTMESWKVGKKLADELIKAKLKKTGSYPKKVAFTLWGGEFIRSQGINLAQIFYLLGVTPVWNFMGRVYDVKLIPQKELKRHRIDVVVQTSGQFRDIAASRIYLINKAVKLSSKAKESGKFKNYVKEGTMLAEKVMKEKGISPKEARMFSTARVFGGVNGNYGTGIMGLVESGDKWEKEKEIADRYLKNMGAVYTKENWGEYRPGIFEGALQNADTVVHPRSSNVYGPLTLDHFYEFMGGLNAVIREVTGNDPDAFFSDIRNKNRAVIQDLKEAIWVETRTKLFNPKYIKDLQKGGASSAEEFAETFRNTYAWNVMKPKAIDKEIWEGLYDVYIKDKYKLNLHKFFKEKNPYALQEMTAVMLETIRKGYWKADSKIIKKLSNLHALLVKEFKAGCSGFVCNNAKLKKMIEKNIDNKKLKEDYLKKLTDVRIGKLQKDKEGIKLKKEKITLKKVQQLVKSNLSVIMLMLVIITLFSGAVIFGVVKRRK